MQQTPNLSLPCLMAGQAMKHITHNEALVSLDSLVQLAVTGHESGEPPAAPAEAARYIVGVPATGDWAGHEHEVAVWLDNAWRFHAPVSGWLAWSAGSQSLQVFDGNAWTAARAALADTIQNAGAIGINATADSQNRLAVSAPSSLFSHEGGSHRLAVNRETAADTASLTFQTGFSGQAELGLAGNDALAIKTSPDGIVFTEAMRVFHNEESGKQQVLIGADTPIDAYAALEVHRSGATANFNRLAGSGGVMMGFYHQGLLRGQVAVAVAGSLVVSGETAILFRAQGTPGLEILPDAVAAHQPFRLKPCTVADLPDAATAQEGALLYVTDAAGGKTPACSDGTDWRRLDDNTIIS